MVYKRSSFEKPYENNSLTNTACSCNIQLLSLKLVLPLSFARLALEFKVQSLRFAKDNFFELAVYI
jgi:hypothetical protein